ncbi:OmpA family protein [Epibacterium sp. SM1979]|uniref:OmpA family protein n=1 Tax=Tritonibacter litoralis TaxID=2662264 RepID=A0A843YGJ2_9RHOB|nr:type IVB secretion system protein IcmH/DotU [Tritonibacter litoralis]MQQ10640.1 OmpA family protein [Tritonibacter litoralis]
MTSDDDDRTVFGQRLPQPPQSASKGVAPQGGEQTIFGMPIPGSAPKQQPAPPAYPPQPAAPAPGYSQAHPPAHPYEVPQSRAAPAPHPQQTQGGYAPPPPHVPGGYQPPSQIAAQGQPAPYQQPAPQPPAPSGDREDTWFGGNMQQAPASQPRYQSPVPPSYPNPAPAYVPQGQGVPPQPGHPASPPGWGQSPEQTQGWSSYNEPQNLQFPDAQAAKQAAVQLAAATPKIAFADALRGSGLNIGHTSNPILAAATDLLVLLGRLRTGIVEMHAIPLRDHVVREIQSFVQKAQDHGIAPEDIETARYALAATADDFVQTIPGSDPGYWQQYSMAAELLNDRSAGIGFFARLEQVVGLSHQRKDVLELMLACLALGFEGKYRADPNGVVALTRIRNELYQRFRSVEPRPGQDLSVHWTPIVLGGRRNSASVPMWIVASVAAAMVVALFATLSGILSSDAQASQNTLLTLTNPNEQIALETKANFVASAPYEAATPAQLDRVRGLLDAAISDGLVQVETKGDFIAIRVGAQLRFKSGSADLSSDFTSLAQSLGIVLEAEQGAIVVEGHSDNIPLSGRGRYRTNEELSQARAETVLGILAGTLSDPNRLSALGVGPNDPLDTANTPEARARNRRVEILIEREE